MHVIHQLETGSSNLSLCSSPSYQAISRPAQRSLWRRTPRLFSGSDASSFGDALWRVSHSRLMPLRWLVERRTRKFKRPFVRTVWSGCAHRSPLRIDPCNVRQGSVADMRLNGIWLAIVRFAPSGDIIRHPQPRQSSFSLLMTFGWCDAGSDAPITEETRLKGAFIPRTRSTAGHVAVFCCISRV